MSHGYYERERKKKQLKKKSCPITNIRTLGEKENYKYLGILEVDFIKQKIRRGKLFETKLCSRNLIKVINTRAVSLLRYSGSFSNWTKKKLRQKDQRTRKVMTLHVALHPRMTLIDSMWRKMGKGNSQALNIALYIYSQVLVLLQQYKDLRIYIQEQRDADCQSQ